MAIRRLTGQAGYGYVIASGGMWLPGRYESERAARYAFRFEDADLRRLQDSVNPDGWITFEMLQALRRSLPPRDQT